MKRLILALTIILCASTSWAWQVVGSGVAGGESEAQNIVVNGDFSSGTDGWTVSTNSTMSVDSGIVTFTQQTRDYASIVASLNEPLVAGATYKISIDIITLPTGGVRPRLAGTTGSVISTTGSHTFYIIPSASTPAEFAVQIMTDIDNQSVQFDNVVISKE